MDRAETLPSWVNTQLGLLGHDAMRAVPLPVASAIVGLDGSSSAEIAAGWSARLARHVDLVTCIDPAAPLAAAGLGVVGQDEWADPMRDRAGRSLARVIEAEPEKDFLYQELQVSAGRGILEVADPADVQLVAVGHADKGAFDRLAMGSVSEQIVHHARVPVLVAKSEAPPNHVIVGVGDDEASVEAAAWGTAIALHFNVELVIATAVEGQRRVRTLDGTGPSARFVTTRSPARRGLLELARDGPPGLLVVGHGRRPGWLGSNAIGLVRRFPGSVLVVRRSAAAGPGDAVP